MHRAKWWRTLNNKIYFFIFNFLKHSKREIILIGTKNNVFFLYMILQFPLLCRLRAWVVSLKILCHILIMLPGQLIITYVTLIVSVQPSQWGALPLWFMCLSHHILIIGFLLSNIEFKILLLVYKALHNLTPSYLSDHLSIYTPSQTLRSSSTCSLVLPHMCMASMGSRAFSYAAPNLSNFLSQDISNSDNLPIFKSRLLAGFTVTVYMYLLLVVIFLGQIAGFCHFVLSACKV